MYPQRKLKENHYHNEYEEKIRSYELYNDVVEQAHGVLSESHCFFTALTGCLLLFTRQGRDTHRYEVEYIKKYYRKWARLGLRNLDAYVDYFLKKGPEYSYYENFLDCFSQYLAPLINKGEKIRLVETLLVLARIDNRPIEREMELIKTVHRNLGLAEEEFAGIQGTARVILDNKIGKNPEELYYKR